jgi:hypothetical protein
VSLKQTLSAPEAMAFNVAKRCASAGVSLVQLKRTRRGARAPRACASSPIFTERTMRQWEYRKIVLSEVPRKATACRPSR